MNLLVIESSPHKHGSSNLLAEHFIRGAREAGHTVTVFDAARASLHPCVACDACGMSRSCCQKNHRNFSSAEKSAAWSPLDSCILLAYSLILP